MMKCECISEGDKKLLKESIKEYEKVLRMKLGNRPKSSESDSLNIKAKWNELNKLTYRIDLIKICTLEDINPFIKDR